jgi:hypothetical protein
MNRAVDQGKHIYVPLFRCLSMFFCQFFLFTNENVQYGKSKPSFVRKSNSKCSYLTFIISLFLHIIRTEASRKKLQGCLPSPECPTCGGEREIEQNSHLGVLLLSRQLRVWKQRIGENLREMIVDGLHVFDRHRNGVSSTCKSIHILYRLHHGLD